MYLCVAVELEVVVKALECQLTRRCVRMLVAQKDCRKPDIRDMVEDNSFVLDYSHASCC